MLKRWLFAILLALAPSAALAQGAVLQQGSVLQGHIVQWLSNGYVADGGGPLANGLSPIDPAGGLLPLGYASVNSGLGTCQFSGYAPVAYSSLCWGFDGSGNGLLTVGNTGAGVTFSVVINGITYPFPGNLAANAVMAAGIPIGNLLASNGGSNIKDGGPPSQFVAGATLTQGKIASGTGAGAYQARYADTGVNILDFNTQACGRGSTDDTPALLAAMASGQDVNLPTGTCAFNSANFPAAIWAASPGSGYVTGDTVTLAGGLTGTVYSLGLSAITLNHAGTGYANGDVVTLVPDQLWNKNQLTAAVWSASGGGTVTFTCTTSCGVSSGQQFTITGMSPGGYNHTFTAGAGTGGSTLVAPLVNNPGTALVYGLLNAEPDTDSAPTITVNTVSAGAIATYTILSPGLQGNPTPVTYTTTGGSGSGATWKTPVWGVGSVTPAFTTAASTKPPNPVSQVSSSGSGIGATFNVTYAVAVFSVDGQSLSGQGASTVVSSTASGSVLLLLNGTGETVHDLSFSAPAMADGWIFFDDGGNYETLNNLLFVHVPGVFAATNHSGQVLVNNIRIIGVNGGGTEGLLNPLSGSGKAEFFGFSPQSKISNGLFLENVVAGLRSSSGEFIVLDGYYQSTRFLQVAINNPAFACFRTQNSYDTANQPVFVNSNFMDCQTPQANGWSISSGQAMKFIGNFCNASGGNCVAISGGVGGPDDIEFDSNRFNGAMGAIFDINTSGQVKIDGGNMSVSGQKGGTCPSYTGNNCPIVGIRGAGANVVVANASISKAAGYGVEALSGAAGVRLSGNLITNNSLGALNNGGTQDCSGILVLDWGPCLQINPVVKTASFVITAANFVNSLANGATTILEVSGVTAGAITATTPTATAALAALPGGGSVGQTWTLILENETSGPGGNITLAGGSGVTVTAPTMTGMGTYRKYNCIVTGVGGGAAITCTGQANPNS